MEEAIPMRLSAYISVVDTAQYLGGHYQILIERRAMSRWLNFEKEMCMPLYNNTTQLVGNFSSLPTDEHGVQSNSPNVLKMAADGSFTKTLSQRFIRPDLFTMTRKRDSHLPYFFIPLCIQKSVWVNGSCFVHDACQDRTYPTLRSLHRL